MDQIEALKREVDAIRWWHQIDLGNGITTPGDDPTASRLQHLKIPDDLTSLTVLDIGAWDGFFSFEAERRGAQRVLATDSFCWDGGGWGSKAGFNLARRVLHSQVEDLTIDPLDLSPEIVGTFDLVLFIGVLYHMRHPLLALERVASVTANMLILQTQVDLVPIERPAIAFYEGDEFNNDPTNWCGPNPPAVVAMLRTVGFKTVEIVDQVLKADQTLATVNSFLPPQHITVHAWR